MPQRLMYSTTISNTALAKTRVIKGSTQAEVQAKVREQQAKWAQEEVKLRQRQALADLKARADLQSQEASALIDAYRNLLTATLSVDDRLDWEPLYDRSIYQRPPFQMTRPTVEDVIAEVGVPPASVIEKVWSKRKDRRLELEARAAHLLTERNAQFEVARAEFERHVEKERAQFEQSQAERNAEVDQFKAAYEDMESDAVERYLSMVLERSAYPENFNQDFGMQFIPESHTAIIDYHVPRLEDVPRVTQYRFVQSRKVIEPIEMKEKDFHALYELTIFQLTLRTIHEVFEADYSGHVAAVVFNGWVSGVDKATGKDFTSCLISCQASREAFTDFDLARVEPKETIRALRGLIAGPLAQLAPVRPIMQINREDSRFIEARDVLEGLDASQNLAEMPWEDFEHLVRELFAQIFSKDGGEVQVTRASRDGGVDAVAFDPDPIRGGKFVIQAKRYNGLVPVSAVRDLYGTMINEGAVKGILVTTSHFGHDSREFVKDKPITLIDGANLIHLFHEHGHQVRIDLVQHHSS